ncbi:DNA replication complex GINS protein PSF2 [Thecamonas trahens ATCC 50062]|uniref:DNA replication complex GINS protein PSF2 n=1 Tax=Thecamonas trahens ATCC 50062 TaxID=461836 RepID=A0A0L0D8T4_THETB|nr:DNA replication complex GINS protein PSF2 [Thecamonas trahens ATCC 50062]KNC48635.1 DNA replication complex GINS protein PSF2 [Thecamonas trahens ATCC 50062]|eukprot:XP_013762691.1 DNA replication complex GINS protein PSF2 [Thecamonas trahens ATCC 50062]
MTQPIVKQASVLESFGASEVEFLSEDAEAVVVPLFREPAIRLLAGTYGPFRPGVPLTVPLWLAKQLKKQKKAKIQPPEWMDVDSLRATYEAEQADPLYFEALPYHYVEIASQLLDVASDDIPDANSVRETIEDIVEVRHLKIMAGMRALDGDSPAIKLNNLAAMEINSIRSFFIATMDHYAMLTEPELSARRSSTREATRSSTTPARASSEASSVPPTGGLSTARAQRKFRPRTSSTGAGSRASAASARSSETPSRFPSARPRPRSRPRPRPRSTSSAATSAGSVDPSTIWRAR